MTPSITKLKLPEIINASQCLLAEGYTQVTEDNLFYLNIDDAFIHQLFPLLENELIKKPDYFGEKLIGAHITISYPEEGKHIKVNDLQQKHSFFIKDIVAAQIGQKTYYVLLVESPSLIKLRKEYGLPDLLSFKGYLIDLHITIGVRI